MNRQPALTKAGEGVVYSVAGDRYVFLATGRQTGGEYSYFELRIVPGGGTPPHVHAREDEGFHIIEGVITFYLGDERRKVVAEAGDFVHAPRGVPHFFRNEGSREARIHLVVTPAGIEDFFMEIGTKLRSVDSDTLPFDPNELPNVIAAAGRHGITLLGD